VVEAELGLLKGQRLLVELEGVGVPAESGVDVGLMLMRVSGWSGPSLAFLSASVSSPSLRASACRPRAA
jgi:hypothetical protein